MYLELAENDYLQESGGGYSPYIFIPQAMGGAGGYIREDMLDDLPDAQWQAVMEELEPYQQGMGLFGFGKKAQERRTQRQTARQTRKQTKVEQGRGGILGGITGGIKNILGGVGGVVKESAGVVKNISPEAQAGIVGAIAPTKGAGGLIGGLTGGGAAPAAQPPAPQPRKGIDFKNPLVIGGGLLLIGGLVFLIARKKGGKSKV